jgi:hypothetical protein
LIENLSVLPFKYIQLKTTGSQIELSQTGLIEKIIKYTGMTNATPKSTPASEQPLGSNKEGLPFDEEWSYPAAVGMLLYISSNTRPDIQFAVHQVARFSHSHRKSHGQASSAFSDTSLKLNLWSGIHPKFDYGIGLLC